MALSEALNVWQTSVSRIESRALIAHTPRKPLNMHLLISPESRNENSLRGRRQRLALAPAAALYVCVCVRRDTQKQNVKKNNRI